MAQSSIKYVILVLLVSIIQLFSPAQSITCYSCSGSGSSTNDNCYTVTSVTPTLSACTRCATSASFSNNVFQYSRSCSSGSSTISCSGSTCYCNTTNCNNLPFQNPNGNYTCYSCQSSNFFDNGCGNTLNSNSVYVQTISGCVACYKTVSSSSTTGIASYSRGCLQYDSTSGEGSCADYQTTSCNTECFSDLCNTGTGIRLTLSVTGLSLTLLFLLK